MSSPRRISPATGASFELRRAGEGSTSGAALAMDAGAGRGPAAAGEFQGDLAAAAQGHRNGHFSHRIAFAHDGTIFLSSGDRQKMEPAQDRNSDSRQDHHLTAEGQRIGGRFYSLGHRKTRSARLRRRRRLGGRNGTARRRRTQFDRAGKNYGWPEASYGSHYSAAIFGRPSAAAHRAEAVVGDVVSPAGLSLFGRPVSRVEGRAIFGPVRPALLRADLTRDERAQGDQWTWAPEFAKSSRDRRAKSICSRTVARPAPAGAVELEPVRVETNL